MDLEWPEAVKQFEAFLLDQKLTERERIDFDEVHFGNKLLRYFGHEISIQIVRDRGDWSVDVADTNRPSDWYFVSRLRQLFGEKGDGSPSLEDLGKDLDFVQQNWSKILTAFSTAHREETHSKLKKIGEEYVRKTFPEWFK
jgi:hypothetical protein